MERSWAFWRRVQYGTGFMVFLLLIFSFIYIQYVYVVPNCFDNLQNGNEIGVDCGGGCTRVCNFEVIQPKSTWARSFRVSDSQYNAVAYIENKNRDVATPEITYKFSLYDEKGLITQREGKTLLPPDSVYPVFEARINTNGRVPTQTFIELDEASVWLPAKSGSNQFTVTNRTLTNADLKPRLEATLLNNDIISAKQVEVIATIFDANGNALTSSRTFIDNFAGRSEETAVFTWPEPIAKTIRSCEVPTDVVLAVDLSGSMNNDQDSPPEPISSVLAAAESFVNRLQKNDQVGLVTFATNAVIQSGLTESLEDVAKKISSLSIDPGEEVGNTNTGDAFIGSLEVLTSPNHNSEARKVLVLLTDGLATAPEKEPEAYALEQSRLVKESDVDIYTIGLGESVNMDFINKIASTPTQAYRALSVSDVDQIYQTITASICEDGAAVIQIVPKTDAGFTQLQ